MKRCQQKDISRWYIHELCQFLHEVKFTLRVILGSMLQNLAKLINEDNQEFPLTLQLVVFDSEFIQNTISGAIHREFLTQQDRQFLIVANNFKNLKLLLRKFRRIQQFILLTSHQVSFQCQQETRLSRSV